MALEFECGGQEEARMASDRITILKKKKELVKPPNETKTFLVNVVKPANFYKNVIV